MLSAINSLDSPPPDDRVVIAALDACHSPAEVYREEDLKQVFGELRALRPDTVLQLVSAIRMKLAGQWRTPELQEQAGTQRTDKEQVAEVLRGYDLAGRLLAPVITARASPPGPGAAASHALVRPGRVSVRAERRPEELHCRPATGPSAVSARRRRCYAAALPDLPPQQQSVVVYRQWFQSALGASDLAYLTRQDRPDLDEIGRVAAAIRGLGDPAAERHLRMFGEAVVASTGELPPHLKPHYLRQALRVLGDHPAGQAARQRLKFYDDLLGEVQLERRRSTADANVGPANPSASTLASVTPTPWAAKAAASSNSSRKPTRRPPAAKSTIPRRSSTR